jgi:hypothetical protein
MAGTLTVTTINGVSTLNAPSGVLATQNGMTGIAKAWVNFNGVTTATIRASFNVSSVTRTSTGTYTINFTTALTDGNFAFAGSAENTSSARLYVVSQDYLTANTSTALYIIVGASGAAAYVGNGADSTNTSVAVFR